MLIFILAKKLLDHFQFTLIHGPNIPGSYTMRTCLQHCTLLSPPDTFITEPSFLFGPASSFFMKLFLCSSPVAYWRPTDLGGSSSWVCHFLLQWTMFCQALSSRDMPFSCSTSGWHVWCPGCLTAGPHWPCKPTPATRCWSACHLGAWAKALLESLGGLGKAGVKVGGHSDLTAASGCPRANLLPAWSATRQALCLYITGRKTDSRLNILTSITLRISEGWIQIQISH